MIKDVPKIREVPIGMKHWSKQRIAQVSDMLAHDRVVKERLWVSLFDEYGESQNCGKPQNGHQNKRQSGKNYGCNRIRVDENLKKLV